jgi:hypothetical protein
MGYCNRMMDPRPLGILLLLVGAAGTAIAALADPLGIGEGEVFGWLQITGTVIGAVVTLLGLVIATEWLPVPWGARGEAAATTAAPQTTVVTESRRDRTT